MTENGWKPKVIAFCCHHCAYTTDDLVGQVARTAAEMTAEFKNIGPNPSQKELAWNDGKMLHRPNSSTVCD